MIADERGHGRAENDGEEYQERSEVSDEGQDYQSCGGTENGIASGKSDADQQPEENDNRRAHSEEVSFPVGEQA